MALQFNPFFFGVMLVVAVGTAAYSLFSSRPQAQRQQQRPRNRDGGPSNTTSKNTLNLSRPEVTQSRSSERRRYNAEKKSDKEEDVYVKFTFFFTLLILRIHSC